MGTFHLRITDLLQGGDSVTIFCFCTERTLWTPERLVRFPKMNRLWDATTNFRCWKCGRLGMVRDMDVHATPVETTCDPCPRRVPARTLVLEEKSPAPRRKSARAPAPAR